MASNYLGAGKTLEYTNASPSARVASGAVVVVGSCVGVALGDIEPQATGAVALEGVFSIPKVADQPLSAGQIVGWDSAQARTTAALSDKQLRGLVVMRDAALDAAHVDVKLTGGQCHVA